MSKERTDTGEFTTEYRGEYARMAELMCAEGGFTDRKLAAAFGVSERTVGRWKKAHAEFREGLRKGKDRFDTQVIERSLVRRAAGFRYSEVTKTRDDEGRMVVVKTVRKEALPDVSAMLFWLKNRQPVRWADRQELDVTHSARDPRVDEIIEEIRRAREGGRDAA